jgi:hypothetical protein
MPGDKGVEQTESDRHSVGNRLKRTTFAVLFSAILLIPRMRRLRRKVLAWTLIRVLAVLAGAWLGWQFARGTAGIPSLSFAVVLVILGLAVRARPERKSVDDVAREVNALVVLNGGAWINGEHSNPIKDTNILVVSDRLVVLTSKLQHISEIQLASVRQVRAQAVSRAWAPKNGDRAAVPWQTELLWSFAGQTHSAIFHFDGFFAEHLARVAEQTITSVWKKQLPVLKA